FLDDQTGEVISPPSDAFDGWRHGVALRFEITPQLPVALDLGYHLWNVDFDRRSGPKRTSLPGPPPTMPTHSLLHELSARVLWHVLDTVDVQVRYAAFFGTTSYWGPSQDPFVGPMESTSSAQRHQVLAGLVFHRSLRRRTPPKTYPPALPAKRLVLRLRIPGAKSVAVLGTFNGWNREAGRLRHDRNGLWIGSFALPPGDHRYTLWIDGTLRPPKNCPTLIPDGFGSRNCAIVIAKER
ncbi:MAG: glycogen-binding domain-containing protein, partial [Deltaproteobacteria bacterium]|nr:glycogen-binding domain-containing protein [Deltaproteobacteria bacterium]